MARRESRRAAELKKLRAELVEQLEQLDFRSENIPSALAQMTQHAERTIQRLLAMSDRDDLTNLHGDRIATTEARLEGFYWVILGQNPPEIAYWERGEWWLAGEAKPWQPEAVTVVSDRLVFRPRLTPAA